MPGGRLPISARIFYIEPRGLWHYAKRVIARAADGAGEGSRYRSDERWLDGEIANGAAQSDIAVYCYTSGTTGRPKGAMLSHAFILDNAYRLMGALAVRAGRALPLLHLARMGGRAILRLRPCRCSPRWSCIIAEKPETVQSDLREVGPEFLMFTPRQWEMLASGIECAHDGCGSAAAAALRMGCEAGLKRVRGRTAGSSALCCIRWPTCLCSAASAICWG